MLNNYIVNTCNTRYETRATFEPTFEVMFAFPPGVRVEGQVSRRRDSEILGQIAGRVRSGRKTGMFFRTIGHRVVFEE